MPGGAEAGRFLYTGQAWFPELGLYYYKARMYSPTLGRFMQTDPVGYTDQINLYAYVANDPVNKVDFSGEESAQVSWDSMKSLQEAFDALPEAEKQERAQMGLIGMGVVYGGAACVAGGCEAAAAGYRAWRFARRLEQVRRRLKDWVETPNRKGNGSRFQDPADKGNRVRVDQGNPKHELPSQQPDHVVEQRGGKTVDADGKPIQADKPASKPEAHIPLTDWLKKWF